MGPDISHPPRLGERHAWENTIISDSATLVPNKVDFPNGRTENNKRFYGKDLRNLLGVLRLSGNIFRIVGGVHQNRDACGILQHWDQCDITDVILIRVDVLRVGWGLARRYVFDGSFPSNVG